MGVSRLQRQWRALRAVCAVLACAGALSAIALEVDGLQLPDTFQVDGKSLQANGAGSRLYSVLRIKVYGAALYTTAKTSSASDLLQATEPRVVHLKMRLSAKRADAIKAWDYYLNANCKAPCALPEPARAAFFKAMADLKTGDEESYIFAANGLNILRNGTPVTSIADASFAKVVLAAWIGDEPTTPELKAALLGLTTTRQ